jgi:hypothetical protein
MTELKPIPLAEMERHRNVYVANIVAAFEAVIDDHQRRGGGTTLERGRAWYQTAHELALMMSPDDVRTGAGVIAALSTQKRWSENVKLAQNAFRGVLGGHVGNALRKAAQILDGIDPSDVLPMDMKTGMFYRCIVDPDDPDAVVIDRHAHDIAVGVTYGSADRGLSSAKRYALLAHCYREAAHRLGVLPSTVQAVTWVAHTERIAGTGNRDARKDPPSRADSE